MNGLRLLLYKRTMSWPRTAGHDVGAYGIMSALSRFGVSVAFASAEPVEEASLAGAGLESAVVLDHDQRTDDTESRNLPRLQKRLCSYWGIPDHRVAALGRACDAFRADVVVASGLDGPPILAGIDGRVRIWQASDEMLWHHVSQLRFADCRTWHQIRDAMLMAAYERAVGRVLDRVWLVSDRDALMMRVVSGVRCVDVLPNGVDTNQFVPSGAEEEPHTAVFWGRLDFGPNIQALEWFCDRVWPRVRQVKPAARFRIVGFMPTEPVRKLTQLPGVELHANVPDIRPEVASRAVVVLPMVSGGGIKNKLLEAAAMGKAIVCTPRALLGLKGQPPLMVVRDPRLWVEALVALWDNDSARRELGLKAREWVVREHTWESAARVVLKGIEESLSKRRKAGVR